MPIRIGTRGSALAMWQAKHVQATLEQAGLACEIVTVTTHGDRVQDTALHQMGSVGIFTKALDDALKAGEIDIAVHSSKDMPSFLDETLAVAAFLKREDPRDVLLATSPTVHFENFTRKLVIGTSSVRRRALLQHYFPENVEVKEIRGNVDSRIARMEAGEYDGILLAYAGVKRLGLDRYIVQKLNTATFTPPVGQGAIGVVARKENPHFSHIHTLLNHTETSVALTCERSFLYAMQGGCSTPVFGFATVMGRTLTLLAGIAAVDGSQVHRHRAEGDIDEAEALGRETAKHLLTLTSHQYN